jgi:hypothetical protein
MHVEVRYKFVDWIEVAQGLVNRVMSKSKEFVDCLSNCKFFNDETAPWI